MNFAANQHTRKNLVKMNDTDSREVANSNLLLQDEDETRKNVRNKLSQMTYEELQTLKSNIQSKYHWNPTTKKETLTPKTDSHLKVNGNLQLNSANKQNPDLSAMTFEQLLQMKAKIGLKRFNELTSANNKDQQNSVRDLETETSNKRFPSFKRASSNHPMEMSSKVRPRTHMQLSNAKKRRKQLIETVKCRDPRFDPLCGEYQEERFMHNYKFVYEIRKKERAQLQEEYDEATDEKERRKIKYLIHRLDNQLREEEKRQRTLADKRSEMQEIKESLMKGEAPTFKKKSEKRIESLVKKYEELKKDNRLEKYMQKKSKKLRSKQRKAEMNDVLLTE